MFDIIVSFSDIYISPGSVEAYLRCGEICNNHIIANCSGVYQWKNFENLPIIGEDMDKVKCCVFLWTTTYC